LNDVMHSDELAIIIILNCSLQFAVKITRVHQISNANLMAYLSK